MRLGILSDTHNDTARMRDAIAALRDRGAGYVIHCGDIGSPEMLDLFHIVPGQHAAGFVFGNDDGGHWGSLRLRAKKLGVDCFEFFKEFTMAGKTFAVLHGDDPHRLNEVVNHGGHDVVLHGHLHCWRDERVGDGAAKGVRVINPGSLYDPRENADGVREKTCAILEVESGRLEKIVLS